MSASWLDAGALVAIDKRDRKLGAMLRVLQHARVPLRTSAAVVAQVWRDGSRQANLARVLAGVASRGLGNDDGRRVGELLGRARSTDVVDAHLALGIEPGDQILTSDPEHIGRLLRVRRIRAAVVRV